MVSTVRPGAALQRRLHYLGFAHLLHVQPRFWAAAMEQLANGGTGALRAHVLYVRRPKQCMHGDPGQTGGRANDHVRMHEDAHMCILHMSPRA